MVTAVSRAAVLGFRVRAQQLDGGHRRRRLAEVAAFDIGVQDTGPDGGGWALAIRGVEPPPPEELILLWSIRGAPHLYRRADLARVTASVAPFSDADAGNRIYDAAKPLKAAGIGNLEALATIAGAMRSVVQAPMVKGELSGRLTELLPPPFVRYCRPCQVTHPYEQAFRLAALPAGLELVPGTSPPVLQPIPGFTTPERAVGGGEIIRSYLRLLGPATPAQVAGYLDAPARDVKARWPVDAVEVSVDGETRWVLEADREHLAAGPAETVRLLPPYDLFLQARDRSLVVPESHRAKELWPSVGRPGGVLVNSDLAGTWRARRTGDRVRLDVRLWETVSAAAHRSIADQAEQVAAHRGGRLTGLDVTG